MAGSDRLRDYEREAGLYRRRAVVAGLGALVVVLVLVGRLFHLQYLSHQHYATLSDNNRMRIEAIAPTRGLIRDRDGRVLAENLPSFTLELVPERVEDLEATLERLRSFVDFDTADVERLRRAWRRARPFEGVPLRFQLSREAVARLSVNRHRFPGVDIVAGLTRHYPWGRTGVHALGYVGRLDEGDLQRLDPRSYRATSHVGKNGIEYAYEEVLHGDPGVRRVEVNVEGRVLRVLDEEAPVPGEDIQLTLDLGLQRFAERMLGSEDGAVVALDPRDGAVLALASAPGFDPNLFVNGIGRDTYAALRDSPHRPLFNRAIRGQYPPGSTIKPIIALNGLERKARDRDETIHCRGYFTLEGRSRRYRDWKAHGEVDLGDAISQSCDVMFYDLAMDLGMTEMADFLRKFGLGQPTGIDLPGERDGLIPDPEWKRRNRGEPWYSGETVIHGIGQGYMQATPLQLATATAQIANHGRPVRPYLLAETGPVEARTDAGEDVPADGDVVVARAREPVVEPVDLTVETDWDFVIDAMVGVTEGEHGTARAIGWESPHTIAGKTGTAQVFSIAQGEEYDAEAIAKQLRDHALFIAFAPAMAPRIAVAVVVENGGSGSGTAAPIAQKLIDRWLEEHPPPEREDDNGG
ncbi:MAG: penicillin-binding protein 2 [Halofilum sp. (in: g-proteobacteria)]|nr:penicillin-binding protein 2 [Halofilum sp. (in: g-proteobacteria)]